VPNTLLPIPHKPQHQDADCLAACAAMALAFVNIHTDYNQLLHLLRVKPYGTSGRNLRYLTSLGVEVIYREGSIDELKSYLLDEVPVIVLVRTADFSHWSYSTDHAVVVIGFDEQTIYINDPAFETNPIAVPITEFELAWMEFDYRYGVILSD